MKPEEVPIPESVSLQLQINQADAERLDMTVLQAQKETEIHTLRAKLAWARLNEEKEKIENQRRLIANNKSGLGRLNLPGLAQGPN